MMLFLVPSTVGQDTEQEDKHKILTGSELDNKTIDSMSEEKDDDFIDVPTRTVTGCPEGQRMDFRGICRTILQ